MPGREGLGRLEHLGRVDSTQRIVRDWLAAGEPEVCLAVADEQTAGRGRLERGWQAPTGAGLLLSVGFRPTWLAAGHAWRLSAVVALAMRAAARAVLPDGHAGLRLKWPNDLVAVDGRGLRKVAGVLAESATGGHRVATAIVGIGVNVDWSPADFPPALAGSMSSLRELAGDVAISRERLFDTFLDELLDGYAALGAGRFDIDGWREAQVTTGAHVRIDLGDGMLEGVAEGLDAGTGALIVREAGSSRARRVGHGEVVRCRVGGARTHL